MPQHLSQSRPYARSCFAVAAAASGEADWAQALDALAQVCSSPEIARLPGRPGVKRDALARLVLAAAGDITTLPKGVDNLVGLLIENHRLALLPDIAVMFRHLWQAQSGRVPVEIQSAYALSPEQLQRLTAALHKRLGAEPDVSVSLQPALGAGAVIRIGDDVLDASLRARLSSFGQCLAHA
ncbi:MAG: F0F1 ATP synthase subunit delta [Proteobacteria bacterium]|nr:F0F1 ATP synthase subunit delta [Pseudomonadota bacterium]